MGLRLFLLRHGQTAHSRDNDFCGSGTDAPLTSDGLTMAQAFGDYYKTRTWDALYASSLSRAQQTITPICNALEQPFVVRPELREIDYGAWEGKTLPEVEAEYPEDYRKWVEDPVNNPPTNGETARDIEARVLSLFEELRSVHHDGNVLLVSHKATIRLAICSLLGIELKSYRRALSCPVCSLSIVEFRKDGAMLNCLADRAHLPETLRHLPGT